MKSSSNRMIGRRAFVAGAVTVLSAPLASCGKPPGKKLPRVTFIFAGTPVAEMQGPEPAAPDFRQFLNTLRARGWIEGQTVVIERRSAERKWDQVPALFTEVIRQ